MNHDDDDDDITQFQFNIVYTFIGGTDIKVNLFLLWDLINCLVTVNSVINGSFICVTDLRDTLVKLGII